MKTLIATLVLALAAMPAFAAKRGADRDSMLMKPSKWYVGLAGGRAKTDLPGITDSTTSYSVIGGYNFNQYFGTELNYTNFGNLDDGSGSIMKSTGSSLSLVGYLPMGTRFALFAKAGYASTSTTIDSSGTTLPSETASGATYGGGLLFIAARSVDVRLGYDVYPITVNSTAYKTANPNLAVLFRF